jgi:septal ring factor EnvC (AmiA/AmiB activator)
MTDLSCCGNEIGVVAMKLETTSTMRIMCFGLAAIAALAFSAAPGFAQVGAAPAASPNASKDAAIAMPAANQPQSIGTSDSDPDDETPDPAEAERKADEATDASQKAQDALDAADEALDSATQARDDLKDDDEASQDQIDAANQAVAQAQADKDAAEEGAQTADETLGEVEQQQ